MLVKTQTITLKSTPFKDNSKILQALTEDLGIISIIVNKLSPKNLSAVSLCSPFTVAEVILKKRNSDLFILDESSILEENLHLRKDYNHLNTASLMAKAVLIYHFPQKKSYNIYLLIKSYLKKIPINPDALYLSFLLKFLHTEGILNLKTQCSVCSGPAQALFSGSSTCLNHSSDFGFKFIEDDYKKLFILCYAKSFDMLKDLEISKELKDKVSMLFNDLI